MLTRMAWAAVVTTLVALLAASTAAAQSTLLSGQTLASGQALASPDGRYELAMQTDGNLVLSVANPGGTPRPVFSSGTGADPGATATLEPTGDLVVSNAQGVPVWGTNSSAKGCANLDVQDDGNLVLYTRAASFWSSQTTQHDLEPGDELLPGQSLYAAGRHYELTMTSGGRLSLRDSAGTLWRSSNPVPGAHAYMAGNGAVEVVTASGRVAWSTPASGPVSGSYVHLYPNGGMAVVEPSGKTAWRADTGATRSGLSLVDVRQAFVGCPSRSPTPPVTTPTGPPKPRPRTPTSSITGPIKITWPRVTTVVKVDWHWFTHSTKILSTSFARFPKYGTVRISCQGKRGCPTRRVRRHGRRIREHRIFSADWRHLARLKRQLRGQWFRVGDRITFAISEPAHRTERTQVAIHRRRRPTWRWLPVR